MNEDVNDCDNEKRKIFVVIWIASASAAELC
jgi:hypothetical protein